LPGYPTTGIFAAVRIRPKFLGIAVAAALSAASARGEEPIPAGIPDLVGARALALSAYRGLAAGNDGIFTNAASLAARRRYAVETQWLLDRAGGDTAFQGFGASVVDSEMGAFTGGFAFTRVASGPWQGNLLHVAMAAPVGASFFVGATAKYGSLNGPGGEHMSAGNVDAAAFWQVANLVTAGVAGYNLIGAGHKTVMPRGVGAGVAVGDERRFHVAVDWRGDFDRAGGKTTNLYAVGGEILVADLMPLRAGYLRDETRNASYWSAGLGVVTSSGVAVDASYRQGIERADDRTFAIGVKLFLFSG
jgi:hypothetical protein